MSADSRFKPPAAVVDDVGGTASRAPVIALAVAGVAQACWFAVIAAALLTLVDKGALVPIGLVFAVAGEACLCVAIVRAVWHRSRPQRTFFAALVSLAACVWMWHLLPFYGLGPLVLGLVIAGIGWKLARADSLATTVAG